MFYIHIFNCIGVLTILLVYQSKMIKQLNNRKRVLEIFLQNPTYSYSKIQKLSKVAKSSVGGILRRYKETQTIERKKGMPIPKRSRQKVQTQSFPCQKSTQKQGFED